MSSDEREDFKFSLSSAPLVFAAALDASDERTRLRPVFDLVLLKLTLAPAMVGTISVLGRRFGSRVVGLLAALPVVAGPTLLIFAWEQGLAFAAQAAGQTLTGIGSLAAYVVTYGTLANMLNGRGRLWVPLILVVSWCSFGAFTLLFRSLVLGSVGGLLVALAGLGLGLRLLPRPAAALLGHRPSVLSPTVGLAVRMAAAALMVGSLTVAARWLGPVWSGLLTPFPVASTVLLLAEHLGAGAAAAQQMLRGFLVGLFGFAGFCACLSATLVSLGVPAAFALAIALAVLIQVAIAQAPAVRSVARRMTRSGVATG